MDFCEIKITRLPIEVPPASEACECGAILDFYGVVRPSEDDKCLDGIDYEFHPRMAEVVLKKIVDECSREFPMLGCRLIHRVEFVPSGETSLLLRVAAAHREAAYDASRKIVELLKKRVPIWKAPRFSVVRPPSNSRVLPTP